MMKDDVGGKVGYKNATSENLLFFTLQIFDTDITSQQNIKNMLPGNANELKYQSVTIPLKRKLRVVDFP